MNSVSIPKFLAKDWSCHPINSFEWSYGTSTVDVSPIIPRVFRPRLIYVLFLYLMENNTSHGCTPLLHRCIFVSKTCEPHHLTNFTFVCWSCALVGFLLLIPIAPTAFFRTYPILGRNPVSKINFQNDKMKDATYKIWTNFRVTLLWFL